MSGHLFPPDTYDGMTRGASLSECGKYRYSLYRSWRCESLAGVALWIMLNPSTADAIRDDPTIRRCISFSKQWGFGSMIVTNLFSLRATNPSELNRDIDPIGPLNNSTILECAKRCTKTIFAWGARGELFNRDAVVISLFKENELTGQIGCLGFTKRGSPRHPLYVPAEQRILPFTEDYK